MSEQPQTENQVADEFRKLGKNLAEILRTAWESPERKRLQDEIENGLDEFGSTLRREFEDFGASETGQRLREDVQEVSERIRSSEMQAKVRDEILAALRSVNEELKKAAARWSAEPGQGQPEPPTSATGDQQEG